jgi:Concanavalin A-like lectin/glucanases superfamily
LAERSRALMRPLLALLALSGMTACGTQYADPIFDSPQPGACSNYVAQFDGASFATADRLIQDDFTIEAWIHTDTSPTGAGFADGSALVFADVEAIQLDDFATGLVNDKFVLSVGGPDTSVTSASDVTTGQWVHLAVTRKRTNGILLLYVNGVLEGSAVGNDHVLEQSPTITIAGRAERNFYMGLLAEVRLWKTVRAQADLVANLHHRLNGNEDGLVGYYRFDDHNSGPSAHDSSPSANDALFTGPVTWSLSDMPLCDR